MCRYDEVRTIQANHLAFVQASADAESSKKLWEKIDEKVDLYANGDLGHAAEAMSLLWEVSKRGRCSGQVRRGGGSTVCAMPLEYPLPPLIRFARSY